MTSKPSSSDFPFRRDTAGPREEPALARAAEDELAESAATLDVFDAAPSLVATGAAALSGGAMAAGAARIDSPVETPSQEALPSADEQERETEPGANLPDHKATTPAAPGRGTFDRDGEHEDGDSPFNTSKLDPMRDRAMEAVKAELAGTDLATRPEEDVTSGRAGDGGTAGTSPFDRGHSNDQHSGGDLGGLATDMGSVSSGLLGDRMSEIGTGGAQADALTGLLMDATSVSASLKPTDGALDAALTGASSPEAQAETAKNAGVSAPIGGAASGGAPQQTAPVDDGVPEPGFWTTLAANGPVDAVVEFLSSSGDGALMNVNTVAVGREAGGEASLTTDSITVLQGQEALGIKNLETAVGKSLGSTQGIKPQDPGPDRDQVWGGRPTPEELAFRNYLDSMTGQRSLAPGQGYTDPVEHEDGGIDYSAPLVDHRALGYSLFGQPGDGDAIPDGGSGSLDGFNRPGDNGAIDYGPDYTGQWTSGQRNDDPSSALDSFGRSVLSITDLDRQDDDEDETDSSEVVD